MSGVDRLLEWNGGMEVGGYGRVVAAVFSDCITSYTTRSLVLLWIVLHILSRLGRTGLALGGARGPFQRDECKICWA